MALIVSLTGIGPTTLDDCSALSSELDARGVALSLLVCPRGSRAGVVLHWLGQRRLAGDAVVLHGYDHDPNPLATGARLPRLGPRAEFAAVPEHEARLRLLAGTSRLDAIGLRADSFAPPRGLASAGTLRALRRAGFTACVETAGIRHVPSGALHRGRALELGARHAEPWRSRAAMHRVARTARHAGLVRLTVDGAALARPGARAALLGAVDAALDHRARPSTCAALLDERVLGA